MVIQGMFLKVPYILWLYGAYISWDAIYFVVIQVIFFIRSCIVRAYTEHVFPKLLYISWLYRAGHVFHKELYILWLYRTHFIRLYISWLYGACYLSGVCFMVILFTCFPRFHIFHGCTGHVFPTVLFKPCVHIPFSYVWLLAILTCSMSQFVYS